MEKKQKQHKDASAVSKASKDVRAVCYALEKTTGKLGEPFEVSEGPEFELRSQEDAERFVNNLMVGDCPSCGSPDTRDCAEDPNIDDACIGRCLSCGAFWCAECGVLLKEDGTKSHKFTTFCQLDSRPHVCN